METSKRMLSWSALFGFMLLIAVPLIGLARPPVTEVLQKGDEWTLSVNGEQARMKILGGRGQKLSHGGYQLSYEVDWGGRKGRIQALSDAGNTSQRVELKLALRNGGQIHCEGYVAQGSERFMAGTCGDKSRPGAWYAQRGAAMQTNAGISDRHRVCEEQRRQCSGTLATVKKQHAAAMQNLKSRSAAVGKCRSELASCRSSQSSGPATQPLSAFGNRIHGRYDLSGRADSVSSREFPAAPSDRDLNTWLRILNDRLLSSVNQLLPAGDRGGFANLESQRCGSNIFCEIGFRQQAIACSLGGC